jgi:hypothetical protein
VAVVLVHKLPQLLKMAQADLAAAAVVAATLEAVHTLAAMVEAE